jgi:hypothetical protein
MVLLQSPCPRLRRGGTSVNSTLSRSRQRAVRVFPAAKKHVFQDIVDDGATGQEVEESQDEPAAPSAFQSVLGTAGVEKFVDLCLDTSRGSNGRGIFIGQNVTKGSVLLELPLDLCISVDYAGGGLTLPTDVPADGPAWPRLKKAIAKDDSLPWDILISLALLDSLSGMGSELFQMYGNTVLPSSSDISLPLCLPLQMLEELQDANLVDKAIEQKDRLKNLFPGLAVSIDGGDGPTWMEYAFACVRSRAFSLGEDHFAFVPALDAANHSVDPNADFTYNPSSRKIMLFAMNDIKAGEELMISYTGRVGYKNKRLLTQYGFVFEHGNPFDTFSLEEDLGFHGQSTTLSLTMVQKALGDGDYMVDTFSGKDPYSYASLKSLPIDSEDGNCSPIEEQRSFLENLKVAVSDRIDAWQSTLRDDESMLEHMLKGTSDSRLVSVMRYRVQAKKRDIALLNLTNNLLNSM